jgi:hypothetical protein
MFIDAYGEMPQAASRRQEAESRKQDAASSLPLVRFTAFLSMCLRSEPKSGSLRCSSSLEVTGSRRSTAASSLFQKITSSKDHQAYPTVRMETFDAFANCWKSLGRFFN